MNLQSVSHAERLAAAKQHLAMTDRAWPSLMADSRRPSLAWNCPEPAPAADEMSLVKLAISWTG
jgi:hypothetical protein